MNNKAKIIEKINKGEVKMKPKWFFGIKKAATDIGLGVSIVAAVACLVLTYFLVKIGLDLKMFEYGSLGRQMFLTNIPWRWVLGFLVSLLGGVVIFSRIGMNYRQNNLVKIAKVGWIVFVLLGIVMLVRKSFELELLINLV